jgi:hypothetical protein
VQRVYIIVGEGCAAGVCHSVRVPIVLQEKDIVPIRGVYDARESPNISEE